MRDVTHEQCRIVIELWLQAKGHEKASYNTVKFPPEFCKKHKLGTSRRPNTDHSFDIVTDHSEYIEIDDYDKHSKTNQQINDGVINDYAENYLIPQGATFIRLQKEEIVDKKGHVIEDYAVRYLRKHLK